MKMKMKRKREKKYWGEWDWTNLFEILMSANKEGPGGVRQVANFLFHEFHAC